MFVLKLPRFFTRLYGEEKRPSSRSYSVFALELGIKIVTMDFQISD